MYFISRLICPGSLPFLLFLGFRLRIPSVFDGRFRLFPKALSGIAARTTHSRTSVT